jgi:hypothetical protein
MNIKTSVQITISAEVERVFDYSINCHSLLDIMLRTEHP